MRLSVSAAAAAIAIAASAMIGAPSPVLAQNYSAMSCGQLWYARNEIYARNGYCFKTATARRAFPNNCFPPYGKLSSWEQREVSNIQSWERRKGCR